MISPAGALSMPALKKMFEKAVRWSQLAMNNWFWPAMNNWHKDPASSHTQRARQNQTAAQARQDNSCGGVTFASAN